MAKDRTTIFRLRPDVRVIFERSSHPPIEYAVVLLARRHGRWHAVRAWDNAHGLDEHHMHRYRGDDKQPPEVLAFPTVNAAMQHALRSATTGHESIIGAWEQIR